ncbi:FAD-dependent monooxygenase [Amycolatopsis sp.]|uniref:FAD-dependent monooxygenase n=1 Tax=Amycolatopsis sp. TaxID=37632 RepID=UPI002C8C1744|nr:FAD-dependent monooxygenase [Amycolatopsis sp.]HVV09961.1 FAD-dependent monooxygenase [Amycolatopsis sp.]
MRIIVVGAGIGGLTTALALLRAGHEVEVVERAAGFGEVGAGLQAGPNATRVLHSLGLAAALEPVAVSPVATRFLRWDNDTVLTEWPLAGQIDVKYGAPYHTLYRPDLIDVLAAALPPDVVRFQRTVTAVDYWDTRPVLRFADGTAEIADIVVGADGIRSAVRGSTVEETTAPFSGMCAYRAMVRADESPEPSVRIWLGLHRHLVAYPAGRYLNLVCVVPATDWPAESWTVPGSLAELRANFRGWSPQLNELLDHVRERVYRWGRYDREPLSHWSTATTTLIGDACPPMLPFLAQAIEDGAATAHGTHPAPVLGEQRAFPSARRTRTSTARQSTRQRRGDER